MNSSLIKVALRSGALYLESDHTKVEPYNPNSNSNPNPYSKPDSDSKPDSAFNSEELSKSTIYFLEQLMRQGFTLDEKALRLLNLLDAQDKGELLKQLQQIQGMDLNWTPLVRNWTEPTNETYADQLLTYFYNVFANLTGIDPKDSVKLPCGHYIPNGTFDLSRYTGCPFCGKPFETNDFVYTGQGSKLRTLTAWTQEDAYSQFLNLLHSAVPLDATQLDSLAILLDVYPLPEDIKIPMRETAIVVAAKRFESGDYDGVKRFILSPSDLLRMLWYLKTLQLKVIEPKTLIAQAERLNGYECTPEDTPQKAAASVQKEQLKLHYTRPQCLLIARVINQMDIEAQKMCEIMNPKRGMWVRIIRALRLAEYARRKDFGHLREVLDRFYRKDYVVLQGLIDKSVKEGKYSEALELLRRQPGVFARELFAMMLRTNPYTVLAEFRKVLDRLPLRLIFDLTNYADYYFNNTSSYRSIRTITGLEISVPTNPRLNDLSAQERENLVEGIRALALQALYDRYALTPMPGKKIYIDPALFNVVMPIGNRTQATEDFMVVPQGSAFPVEGDKVRLFLHWGKGMAAAHIDLDLSASIIYEDKVVPCAYYNLSPLGACHSGDIRQIPDQVGTAEYVELDVPALREDGALYVAFTANAYSYGSLLPNAMIGWMSSANPMTVSNETGVAYDPSTVQYMVKVDDKMMQKGMLFGVLDVRANEVIWLEMAFDGQTVAALDNKAVLEYLRKIRSKLTIGKALETLAKARGMEIVDAEHIDTDTLVYDRKWAYDIPKVTSVLLPQDTLAVENDPEQ